MLKDKRGMNPNLEVQWLFLMSINIFNNYGVDIPQKGIVHYYF